MTPMNQGLSLRRDGILDVWTCVGAWSCCVLKPEVCTSFSKFNLIFELSSHPLAYAVLIVASKSPAMPVSAMPHAASFVRDIEFVSQFIYLQGDSADARNKHGMYCYDKWPPVFKNPTVALLSCARCSNFNCAGVNYPG